MDELLVEEGTVLSIEKGVAEVEVFPEGKCEECSAKIFCKPNKDNKNIVRAENSIGAKIGENVRIEIKCSSILSASFVIYGLPLIILVAGIFLGLVIFSSYKLSELYSALFSIGLTAIYFLLTFFQNKKEKNPILPKIVSIKKIN
jgi:sigma-E factor negative regulatory protein RseC